MHESNLSGGLIHSTFCFDSHLIRFVIVKRKDVFSNFIFKKKIKIFLQSFLFFYFWGKNLEWLSCELFQMQKVLFDRTKRIDLPISPNPDFLLPQVFSHSKVQDSRRYQVCRLLRTAFNICIYEVVFFWYFFFAVAVLYFVNNVDVVFAVSAVIQGWPWNSFSTFCRRALPLRSSNSWLLHPGAPDFSSNDWPKLKGLY